MLRQCLDSVLSLSLSADEREIILVDDGSVTSPITMLADVKDDIVFVSQSNQGLSVARNTGIAIAKGEYIQFIDSDDYLLSAAYDTIISHVKKHRMDMLTFYFATTESEKKEHQTACLSQAWQGNIFLCHNNLRAAAWSYIFRRDILGDLRFYPSIYHEDALFTPQLMLKTEKLHTVHLNAYFYRQHGDTIMSKRDRKHITKRLDDSVFILHQLSDKASCLDGYSREALNRCINQQVMAYIYFLFFLKCSVKDIHDRVRALRKDKLFPLPLKRYTTKYLFFAILSRCIY